MGKDVHSLDAVTLPAGGYVLVLPGWYPTWLDPMPGDFNQRHVKAAGLYKPQVVLYIGKDQSKTLSAIQVRFSQLSERVVEIRVVYPEEKLKAWDIFHSNIQFIKLLYKYAQLVERRFGKPDLLHAYIVLRGGLAGYLLKKKWNIPLLLTENWTIYYPEDPGYYGKRNVVFKHAVKRVFASVDRFLPVTFDLQQHAEKLFGSIPSTVIPNVVDTEEFYPLAATQRASFRFVHISTMVYQKNPEGLLRAFKAFSTNHTGVQLWMVGPYPDEVKQYAKSLSLTDAQVHFTGVVPYESVAAILRESDGLILFSRYENLPCVILEAQCCGLPVISSKVGGVAEVVDDETGVLVQSGNENQLQVAFEKVYASHKNFDKIKIAETAKNRFSYAAVGASINRVYQEILGR